LTRSGRGTHSAAAIAERVACDLADSALSSRAWSVAAQAYYLSSEADAALHAAAQARRFARSRSDECDAQWQLLCAAKELELPNVADHFNEFHRLASTSPGDRLRVACGRIFVGYSTGSFEGLWRRIKPLLAEPDLETDPMVASGSLIMFGDLALSGADYQAAAAIAERLNTLSLANQLDFALWASWTIKARAEIGLRRLKKARASLVSLRAAATQSDDPYLQLQHQVIATRLEIARGSLLLASKSAQTSAPAASLRTYYAEGLAISAVALAALGRHEQAMNRAAEARALSSVITTTCVCDVAELIGDLNNPEKAGMLTERARELFERHCQIGFLDALVLGYRAQPALVSLLLNANPAAEGIMSSLLASSRDHELAGPLGLQTSMGSDVDLALTPREREVWALLAGGCSNAEIAERLFISTSTAKVHVRNILRKLGARSRLEAVAMRR
jgi:DNA-binding CsgD family transcriptional regulator